MLSSAGLSARSVASAASAGCSAEDACTTSSSSGLFWRSSEETPDSTRSICPVFISLFLGALFDIFSLLCELIFSKIEFSTWSLSRSTCVIMLMSIVWDAWCYDCLFCCMNFFQLIFFSTALAVGDLSVDECCCDSFLSRLARYDWSC